MNLSNIEVGNIYKNYKALCEILEEKNKTGNAKKAQLKEWERFFKYEKEGNKFIITHVYAIPLPENNNKTKYIPTIEKLILDKVVQFGNKGKVFISKSQLMQELKMINENYTFAKYKQLRLAKHMNISLEEVEEFYMTSDDLLKRNIEAALNSLRNQSLIFWTNAMTLCFIETHAETNNTNNIKATKEERTNEYNENTVSFSAIKPVSYQTYRKATEEEIEYILQVEKEVLNKYNCDKISETFKKGLNNKFYKEVKEILFDTANIYYYFNSYEIIANEKYIYSKWEELEELQLELDERETYKNTLNYDVIDRINHNAERRHLKAIETLNDDAPERIKNRSNENYLSNSYKLTDTLINKNALSLKREFNIK
ncbi:hypothetical protein AF332_11400 [Sporosarcina globispora]|uniref:Uncharacterized protein n=1 Tax=Sporosarcina globispora TaxID=1459 RepID=A0A0M0GBZ6_SPOGL|nr:hypothetical protein [Sporosarcina globispora]KON87369.1 hypothetical protein AF332_11400 [Sporosarcina globispora]